MTEGSVLSPAASSSPLEGGPLDAPTPVVLLIHPLPLMRLGVQTALAQSRPSRRVTGCSGLADARECLSGLGAGDIILFDAAMWQASGADPALDQALARGARLALIATSDFPVARLNGAGSLFGCLSADIAPAALAQAVCDLAAGREVFPKSRAGASASGLARLSNRQFEILELMTRGLLNKQIAWELGLTEGTVKSHVSAILEKLGCDRRTQAIAAFMRSFGVAGQSLTA